MNASLLLKYWLPVLLWMAVIFSASSDSASFQHSSRIIGPLLHWLAPGLSEEQIHLAVVVVRKAAHVSEYAVLAWLVWRLVRSRSGPDSSAWSWREASRTLLVVVLYAASDEFHQLFVPSREASIRDVLIDTSGALLTLLCLWFVSRWQQSWFKSTKVPDKSASVFIEGIGAD